MRIDPPGPTDLVRRQDAQPDVPIRGHVVHAERIGRLLQRDLVGRVDGHGAGTGQLGASVPANTCQASNDLATRLRMM